MLGASHFPFYVPLFLVNCGNCMMSIIRQMTDANFYLSFTIPMYSRGQN